MFPHTEFNGDMSRSLTDTSLMQHFHNDDVSLLIACLKRIDSKRGFLYQESLKLYIRWLCGDVEVMRDDAVVYVWVSVVLLVNKHGIKLRVSNILEGLLLLTLIY